MSKSRKKVAIVKDKTGRWYNKIIRRRQNQEVRRILTLADIMDYNISHPNEIVNKYAIGNLSLKGILIGKLKLKEND